MKFWIGLLVVVAIIGVLAIYIMGTYNKLVRSKNQVEEAFSTMDIFLLKRSDLIPDLVKTVKASASHERETLESVIAARSHAVGATSTEDRLEAEGELSQAISRLLVVAEAYPDLKANSNFLQMQNDLKSMEGEIENSRRYYNGTVKYHNNAVSVFPANFVANQFNFEKEELFVLPDETKREKPEIEF